MKALIIGQGLSGNACAKLLKNKNIDYEFASENDINDGKNLSNKNYVDRLFNGLSFIVVSPGISKNAKIVKIAENLNIKIISEFEFGSINSKGDIISVTGTNGKTTTVSIINFLLRKSKRKIYLGGNIGIPVSKFALKTKEDDIVVLEASSFQLERVFDFHAHIAAILNFQEDHLNRYKNMQEYINAKLNISINQTENDYFLVNADDFVLMKNIPKTNAKIMYFSVEKKVLGCYIKDESIYFNDNLCEKKLVSINDIKLVGKHNLSNILCACLAVYLETKNEKLLKDINKFVGIEHRIEYVKTINGVEFFNDSKATNIDSTLVALNSLSAPINLILGGSDKGYNFDRLFANLPKNVINIAVFGETKHKIAVSAKKYRFEKIYMAETLKNATKKLFQLSKSGEVILLSPACASFDFFSNYEERGFIFKKIVEEISNYENALDSIKKET